MGLRGADHRVRLHGQAMGLVNDHLAGCHARDVCEAARVPLAAHYRLPPGDDIVPGSM